MSFFRETASKLTLVSVEKSPARSRSSAFWSAFPDLRISAAQALNKGVLGAGHNIELAADTSDGAAGSFGGLFTLIAEHNHTP